MGRFDRMSSCDILDAGGFVFGRNCGASRSARQIIDSHDGYCCCCRSCCCVGHIHRWGWDAMVMVTVTVGGPSAVAVAALDFGFGGGDGDGGKEEPTKESVHCPLKVKARSVRLQ